MPNCMNTCFAVKRWPEPEEWTRIVAEEFGLKTVQFSFDLMDPRQGSGVVGSYIDHTRIACAPRSMGTTRTASPRLCNVFSGAIGARFCTRSAGPRG